MRSELESQEVCETYNLDSAVSHAPSRSCLTNILCRWCRNISDLEKSSVRFSLMLYVWGTALLTMVHVADLLHAGASYLRIHQKGFGAVGVSTKYGQRAFARYPIFWGMKDVGGTSVQHHIIGSPLLNRSGLPNPDPTDTAPWSGEHIKPEEVFVDNDLEASKPTLKRQAQNWAGFVQFHFPPC